jgi:threonine dehydrogenase-like Zn-dependent dehydrogenase
MNLPSTMRSLQLHELGRLAEARLPVPMPTPNDVLVKTAATTICTSDINDIYHNPFGIMLPRVIGHEGAGTIASLGRNVKTFSLGERVAAHPVIPCGNCSNCRRDLEHLCTHMGHLGIDRNGTFAEYFVVRSDRVRRVPAGLGMETAALLEPMSVCLEAIERARLRSGETLLIVGDGPFGILIGRLALRHKPGKIIFVGRHDFRLRQIPEALAIRYGRSTASTVKTITGGEGVDVAILATGNQAAVNLCLSSLRARGRMVVFSAMRNPCKLDLFKVHTQELEILGCCNDKNLLDIALRNMADPDLKLSSLVTHRLPFTEWPQAFKLAGQERRHALKVALIFDRGA